MIVLGLLLTLAGFYFHIHIVFILGVILLVVGVILLILGAIGHPIGGRNTWW